MAATYYCADCFTTFGGDEPSCPNLSCGISRPDDGWGALLQPGEQLDRHYQVGRPLAVGGAGITYLAREIDAEGKAIPPDLAIKVLYTSRAAGTYLRRLANEAQILQELDHEHIVTCRGFVQRTGHPPYLVTLFESGGNLAQHIARTGPMSPRVAAATLRQILLALDVAHQRGVIHRDLKPDNVLLRAQVEAGEVPHVRVADFGIAKVAGALHGRLTRVGTFIGTPEFAAPEQFRGETPTPAADVFAAGTLLAFLLTGSVPFVLTERTDLERSYHQMLQALPCRPPLPDATERERAILHEILHHMHALQPDRRWTVHQILAHLAGLVDPPTRAAYQTIDLTNQGAPVRELAPGPPAPSTLDTVIADPSPSNAPTVLRSARPPSPSAAPAVAPPSGATGPAPAAGGGLARVIAGLGAAGFMLTLVGGGILTALILLGVAWSAGWMGPRAPASVRLDPVALSAPLPAPETPDVGVDAVAWLGGDASHRAARAALHEALDGFGEALGERCGPAGRVLGSLWLDGDGRVVRAQVDGPQGECLAQGLQGEAFPNATGAPGMARVAFEVGPG